MRHLTLVATAAAGLAMAGTADAANLILNGSFETGDFTSWSRTGTATDGFPATVLNYNSATPYPTGAFGEAVPPDDVLSGSPDAVGDHAAYFVSDFADEVLSQTVHLTAGLYTIGFSAYLPFNGYANFFDGVFTGSVAAEPLANFAISSGTPGKWNHYAGLANIVVEGDYTTSFTYKTNGFPAKDVVIDRVYIVAGDRTNPGDVPEPSTWALMIIGFGSAGAMLRRRRPITA